MDGEADKSELYDRQIRLWGESGQKALESVRLCALSSGFLFFFFCWKRDG